MPLKAAGAWAPAAYGELHAAVRSLGATRGGSDGALFFNDLFETENGELVVFVPVTERIELGDRLGRVGSLELPAAELAIMVNRGSGSDIDRTYAALGSFVAHRAIGVAGPIWENFTVTAEDTDVVADWRTEVGWPVFSTVPPTEPPTTSA
jgi:effector-binding domain-containing protein